MPVSVEAIKGGSAAETKNASVDAKGSIAKNAARLLV